MCSKERKVKVPSECPVCGAQVATGSMACPRCGADERTGWNEEMTLYDGMDLPDSALEDESSTKRSIHKIATTPTGIPYFTWIVAAGLLVLIVTLVICRIF